MKNILTTLIIFSVFFLSAGANDEYISNKLGCAFRLPPCWKIDSTTSTDIFLSDSLNHSVNAAIYKYLLDRNGQIGSDEELIEAIMGLYQELGIEISPDENIDYSLENSRAVFDMDFEDYNTTEERYYHKSLRGILAQLNDGGQVLYLIIAKSPKKCYESSQADINLLLYSFRITKQLSDKFYVRNNFSSYLMTLLIFLLIAFFFSRNRRIQKSKNPLGRDSSHFWRCPSCHRVNHIDNVQCNRCGKAREIKSPTGR